MSIKKCRLCRKLTEGSVGASGIKWGCICQECKDREDRALLQQIKGIAKYHKLFVENIEKEKCEHEGERKNGICLECGKEV